MVQVFKKRIDEHGNESWLLVEELQDDLALAQRLMELRSIDGEYRAERKIGIGSEILDQ